MKKPLGGTGTISSAATRLLAESGYELWLLNLGNRAAEMPAGVRHIVADINDERLMEERLGDQVFDAVCEFIGFLPFQVERNYRLFRNLTHQYIYITSDESLTWNQIHETIAATLGVPLKPCHAASDFLSAVAPQAYDMEGKLLGDKAASVVFDNSKLKSLVPGFHAQVTFADGVRRTIDHIMKHPELQVEDPEFEAWCERVVEVLGAAKREVEMFFL